MAIPLMSLVNSSDEDLLVRAGKRDEASFAELERRFGRMALAIARRMVGDSADDVVQEAWIAIWRRADTYRPERGMAVAWLMTIVRHRAIDSLRSRRDTRPLPAFDHPLMQRHASPDGSAIVIARSEALALRAALYQVTGLQREAIVLAYFGGLSYPEIAALISAPLPTVKSRIRRRPHAIAARSLKRPPDSASTGCHSLPAGSAGDGTRKRDRPQFLVWAVIYDAAAVGRRPICGNASTSAATLTIIRPSVPSARAIVNPIGGEVPDQRVERRQVDRARLWPAGRIELERKRLG